MEHLGEAAVFVRGGGELLLETGEGHGRGGEVEAAADLPGDVGDADAAFGAVAEQVGGGALDLVLRDGEPQGAVALGIHVHQQGALALERHDGGKVDGGGGFATASLLVDDRNRAHGADLPSLEGVADTSFRRKTTVVRRFIGVDGPGP